MTLCRADDADSTDCAGEAGNWQHWIVRPVAPADAAVVRRGIVNEFSGGLSVQSTLTDDQVVFGGDGLARTGGVVIDDEQINVCTTDNEDQDTRRRVVLGSGSRLSTEKFAGDC
jgi:type IV fimbrial biogenesis protein FimT